MPGSKQEIHTRGGLRGFIHNKSLHRLCIGIMTLVLAFAIVQNGASPKKYRISEADKSDVDIIAPVDIENELLTTQLAQAAADAVPIVMTVDDSASIEVLGKVDKFFTLIDSSRKSVEKDLKNQGITKDSLNYKSKLDTSRAIEAGKLIIALKNEGMNISLEQAVYVGKASDESIEHFRTTTMEITSSILRQDITEENLPKSIVDFQNSFQDKQLSQELTILGQLIAKSVLLPNRVVNSTETENNKKQAYENAMKNRVIISKGERIINKGDIVTKDKFEVLSKLNLVENNRFDILFSLGIFLLLTMLGFLLVLFMNKFCNKYLLSRVDIFILSLLFILVLLIARGMKEYSALAIPVFIATVSISILFDLRLAIFTNVILVLIISLMTNGDLGFLFMGFISGTFSAFLVSRVTQRSRLSLAGLIMGLLNVLIILSLGVVNKIDFNTTAINCAFAFINGVASMILTIGLMPFWESAFNVITPLKLLELANPNQPLIRKLLLEAPGTYHHSLLVGNLAEVATEAIGGDALLARVGAYYHDIGKLRRPNFFKENQLLENPHDRMTANLSTLVITSHTGDGDEMAEKHKLPGAIRDIIRQHHGTTLVAFFFHKAKSSEKGEDAKLDNFRYPGPKPSSKEAAVVMLADCVEAAVRSMPDKSEGKIEGLVRKIIKDKLDDGQLDLCNLTLKELNDITKAFMKVLSGLFHERQEYPDIKPILKEVQGNVSAEDVETETNQNIQNVSDEIERTNENELIN